MEPSTISELLMFNTVRLVANDGSSGTGYFYNFEINNQIFPTIITNKHVVKNNPNETMTFFLHLKTGEKSSSENYQVTMPINWIFHSSKDLCFCFINPVFEAVKQNTGKDVFYSAIDASIFATEEILRELTPIEELVMVGYPIGLWDFNNNFPIFRKGYTASHPAIDFNQDGIGLVDMACYPGSSGSPIFVYNESGYSDKKGNVHTGNRIIFLGTLYAGPYYNAQGKLTITNIPTTETVISSTPVMINLGYYIKATEIYEFYEFIKNNFT